MLGKLLLLKDVARRAYKNEGNMLINAVPQCVQGDSVVM